MYGFVLILLCMEVSELKVNNGCYFCLQVKTIHRYSHGICARTDLFAAGTVSHPSREGAKLDCQLCLHYHTFKRGNGESKHYVLPPPTRIDPRIYKAAELTDEGSTAVRVG